MVYPVIVYVMSMFQNDIIIHFKMVAIKLPYLMLKITSSSMLVKELLPHSMKSDFKGLSF